MSNAAEGGTFDGPEPLDFGSGVTGRFTCWEPDRELNPQYTDTPDVEHWGLIWTHTRPDGNGTCSSALTFDGDVQRQVSPEAPRWQIESWEPLTLSPSILCTVSKGGCGRHGFIREGRWVDA